MTEETTKKVSFKLGAGIFFFPYIFSWALLQKGYSTTARRVAFGWTACLVLTWALSNHDVARTSGPQPAQATTPPTSAEAATPPTPAASADPKLERANAKVRMTEIEKRMAEKREDMKKFYANAHDLHTATDDRTFLTALSIQAEMTKDKEDLAIATRAKAVAGRLDELVRDMYANTIEEAFMKDGMDIKVRTAGRAKDQLTVKYALMSQPLVYKFQNEAHLGEQAKLYGFRKLVFTNGFESGLGQTWTIDL